LDIAHRIRQPTTISKKIGAPPIEAKPIHMTEQTLDATQTMDANPIREGHICSFGCLQ
jgi:hypothetical protein